MASRSKLIKGLVAGDLKLFRTTAPEEELQKGYWTKNTNKVLHNIKMREESDILNPSFRIPYDDTIISHPYNYCYYFDNKRFYWIRNVKKLPQGQMELICEVDPLYSFVNEIFNMTAFEDRATDIGTGYVADPEIIFNASPQAKVYEFEPVNRGFAGESYILSVANIMKLKSKPNIEDPVDIANYLMFDNSADNVSILINLITQMETWRRAHWAYSQDNRGNSGFVDCSSLIARAVQSVFGQALFTTEYKYWVYDEYLNPVEHSQGTNSAASIAQWFYEHQDNGLSPDNPDYKNYVLAISSLDGMFSDNAKTLQTGDLLFFEVTGDEERQWRFPNNGEVSGHYHDAKREIFGSDMRDGMTPYKGIGHIAFVYRGHQDPIDNIPAMMGYNFNASTANIYVADSGTPAIPEDGIWTIEALPWKNSSGQVKDRKGHYLDANGNEFDYTGTKGIADGIFFMRRCGFSSKGDDLEYKWGNYKPYFYIRPNWKNLYEDFHA